MHAAERRPRRHDPDRRERIISACLSVIAAHGVSGTTHRRVAAAADVPLGSMTYHFDGVDDLLRAAFDSFADRIAQRFEVRLAAAADPTSAQSAVVDLICGDALGTQDDLALTTELYALAAHDPRFRDVTNRWMRRSRTALERHFDPATARILDALIEGLTLHAALDTEPQDPAVVREAVARACR